MKATRIAPVLALLLVATAFAPVGNAHVIQEQTYIYTGSDGSAVISQTFTYDLDNETESAKYTELKNNETAKQEFKQSFKEKWENYATPPGGEEPVISEPRLRVREDPDSNNGVVQASVQWKNFAKTSSDGSVVVDSPLSEDFSPDMTVILVSPRDHTISSAEQTNTARNDNDRALIWSNDPDLNNLKVTFSASSQEDTTTSTPDDSSTGTETPDDEQTATETPSETTSNETGDTTSSSSPGFGIGAALAALTGAALYRHRKQ